MGSRHPARLIGFLIGLMTGSAFHKAMAQDAVRLSQMTGNQGLGGWPV